MEKLGSKKVMPYSFEEFWDHLSHSPTWMKYQHVTYKGKIHDMPNKGGAGSIPWLYGEYLRDLGIEGSDRMYRVSVYCSIANYVGYHFDLFKKKKLIIPGQRSAENTLNLARA